jgi:hypothetical protein
MGMALEASEMFMVWVSARIIPSYRSVLSEVIGATPSALPGISPTRREIGQKKTLAHSQR